MFFYLDSNLTRRVQANMNDNNDPKKIEQQGFKADLM
jgi:hypothetical protein